MRNFFKQIQNLFQLKLKWVRMMLIISTTTVLVLFIIPPSSKHEEIPVKALQEQTMDEFAMEYADSTSTQPILAQSAQPIEIKIINEEKEEPFDWKGTITWAIGAINGLILVILNIKNLIKKK